MDYTNVKRQVGEIWVDGNGQQAHETYVDKWLKTQDRKVYSIFVIMRKALEQLTSKKKDVVRHAELLKRAYEEQFKPEHDQQSYTFYNFDRSLMFEIDSSSALEYDKNLIEQASIHFKAYLDDQMGKIDPMLKEVLEAMILDVRKQKMIVGTVKKLESMGRKVEHPEMEKAMEMIDEAKQRGLNRTYYRIRVRNGDNQYDMMDINFSAIDV